MKLEVNTQTSSYDVIIERGALDKIEKYIPLDRRVIIVTDDGVPSQYAKAVADKCTYSHTVVIKQGEESKNFDNYKHILSEMLSHELTRFDCVIAVGGGVIGDMAGFAASTYMRGIDFYNIPTTFLSQVDSSIGGKVAIDFGGIKNAVGAFYPPKGVVIDPNVLSTLDKRQVKAGFAETIKMAATSDRELFELIEQSSDFESDTDMFIERSLMIKRDVVEKDPNEKGLRRVLNFGHTVGHAIESYNMGKLLHGECVSLGMMYMCSKEAKNRLSAVLEKYGLPSVCDVSKDEIIKLMRHDKKAVSGGVNAVYLHDIGNFEIKKISFEELGDLL